MKTIAVLVGMLLSFMSYSQFAFETTYPLSIYQNSTEVVSIAHNDSLHQVSPKNVLYVEFNFLYFFVSYERIFNLNQYLKIATGAGLGIGVTYSGYGEYPGIYFFNPSLLIGKTKNYAEIGSYITPQRPSWGIFSPHAGYRLQSESGFTFKIEAVLIMQFEQNNVYPYDKWVDIFVLPGIAFGKTF
jgi:hypothetical protein